MAEYVNYIYAIFRGERLLPVYLFIPIVLMGPGTVGLTYIMRNFSKQEHAFVWSDFWEYTRKYLGKGLVVSLIMTILFYLYSNSFIIYMNAEMNKFLVLIFEISIGLFFIMASFYVYPLMITFDMKIKDIFKYASILVIANYPKNLILFCVLILVYGVLFYFAFPAGCVLMPVFLIGWTSYTINYVVWGAIDRFILKQSEQ